MQMEPTSYRFKGQAADTPKRYGFIAQDVEPLFPGLVHQNEEYGNYTMNYAEMSTVAIAAVQEQQALIQTLQEQVELLKTELESLKKANK